MQSLMSDKKSHSRGEDVMDRWRPCSSPRICCVMLNEKERLCLCAFVCVHVCSASLMAVNLVQQFVRLNLPLRF